MVRPSDGPSGRRRTPTRAEALEIVRGLIARVVLHPIAGGFESELEGDLTPMVEAGQVRGNKKAASLGETAWSLGEVLCRKR